MVDEELAHRVEIGEQAAHQPGHLRRVYDGYMTVTRRLREANASAVAPAAREIVKWSARETVRNRP